jgi:N-acetylneuraminate synthase/N,N'-diacetyllegionaminate synthase
VKIGNIDINERVLVIAEIGNNHEGDYALAEKMIKLAAEAGAGAVKFQTIVPEKLIASKTTEEICKFRKFQLSYGEYEKLHRVANDEGLIFLSTPFDLESARFLNDLVPAFKIASGDNNFFELIELTARTGKPIILSSGLADIKQIVTTKILIQQIWKESTIKQELAVLHCVSSYPVKPDETNLLAIKHLQEKLDVIVGYSDHTMGIEAAVLSVALGARIIEKHFTLDKNYSDFRDHQLSADPEELSILVKRVENADILLGVEEKCIQKGEKENFEKMRRSIVADHDLRQGTILRKEDLTWLRPGGGLEPGRESEILDKKIVRNISAGEYITLRDVVE